MPYILITWWCRAEDVIKKPSDYRDTTALNCLAGRKWSTLSTQENVGKTGIPYSTSRLVLGILDPIFRMFAWPPFVYRLNALSRYPLGSSSLLLIDTILSVAHWGTYLCALRLSDPPLNGNSFSLSRNWSWPYFWSVHFQEIVRRFPCT